VINRFVSGTVPFPTLNPVPPSYHRVAAAMMVASVVPPSLAGSALARPAAAFVRTRLLSPGEALSGSASRPASGCSVARGGGARRPLISFAAGGGAGEEPFLFYVYLYVPKATCIGVFLTELGS
jgi:hypothetical protein